MSHKPNIYQNWFDLMTTPLSAKGIPKNMVYLIGGLGLVYLLNPGAGIIELIPDNIPIIGNFDEGGAAMAVWYGVLEYLNSRRNEG